MAGLIKRKNSWVAIFSVAGKQIRKTTKIAVTPSVIPPGKSKMAVMRENEAKARLIAEELEKAANGERVDAEKVKAIAGERAGRKLLRGKQYMQGVKEYLEEWMKSRQNGTLKNDRVAVKRFLALLGDSQNMPLDMVTSEHARRFMEKELERVSSGTVKNLTDCLRAAFNRAIDGKLIGSNPFHRVTPGKLDKTDKHERRAFTMEEAKRLTEILPGEWPDMVRVCLYTGGQRLGDIAKLKWEQINLEGGLIAMTTEKTKRRMNKPIISSLKDVLKRRYEGRVSDYVFPLAAMKHAQADNTSGKLSLEFHELLKEHGFIENMNNAPRHGDRRRQADLSFHSLRATAVTALRLAGVPSDLCRVIVGHDSEEIERVYFRPDSAAIAEAMKHLSL